MLPETGRDLFIVLVDLNRRAVARKRLVDRADEGANSLTLARVVVRVVAADHPLLVRQFDAPRLRAQLRRHLNHHLGGNGAHLAGRWSFQDATGHHLRNRTRMTNKF